VRAIEPTAGEVSLNLTGEQVVDVLALQGEELKSVRPKMRMVCQDPTPP